MVYCGKPSKACDSCRARRIKCDLRQPSCSQCSRISRTCPGYREQLDLSFRDESASVAQKFHTRQKRLSQHSSVKRQKSERAVSPRSQKSYGSRATSVTTSSDVSRDEESQERLTWGPALPSDDFATAYFMNSYIQSSHFDYLPQVCATSALGSPLFAALTANACANMYRETGVSKFHDSAQDHYARALRQTKVAINSPDQAILDSTISAVLLLGLYENLTQGQRKCPESFIAHQNGAAALLKERGEEQFKTKLGKRIFAQVSMNMRVTCADRHVTMPSDFLTIDEIAANYFDENDFLMHFLHIVDEFNDLRDAAEQEVRYNQFTTATVETAMQLDQCLTTLLENMATSIPFDTIPLDHATEGVHGPVYHRYTNHRIAQKWNAVRMMRIILNQHVHKHMGHIAQTERTYPDSDNTGFILQSIAARNVVEMGSQICASVPQFCKPGTNGLLPVTPTLFLLWPLAVAGHSGLSSPEMKSYAVDRLRYLGTKARLQQGIWAAEMIEGNQDMEDWLHLSQIA